jgi:hypothetical protein
MKKESIIFRLSSVQAQSQVSRTWHVYRYSDAKMRVHDGYRILFQSSNYIDPDRGTPVIDLNFIFIPVAIRVPQREMRYVFST